MTAMSATEAGIMTGGNPVRGVLAAGLKDTDRSVQLNLYSPV